MEALALHASHVTWGGKSGVLNGHEVVFNYGEVAAEHAALTKTVGLLDFSFRGRICLTGADRVRFLHGQVTNDVKGLRTGQGCYAALITAKGRIQSDLNIYALREELLLDFEPGLTALISERLDRYIIADDVQIVDAAPHYGLLSLQGPLAGAVAAQLVDTAKLPPKPFELVTLPTTGNGDRYLVNQPRLGTAGFDCFLPAVEMTQTAELLRGFVQASGGRLCGWEAFDLARIEAGIPRFGVDMDDTNLPLESGLETRAISYNKGCYIGQEVISRIRTYSEAARTLRRLRLAVDLTELPAPAAPLFHQDRPAGYITSAARSVDLNANLALGYVRKEFNQPGATLILRHGSQESPVTIIGAPFGCGE